MLRFAVAGCPLSTPPSKGTLVGLRRAKELGINAMELEWVQQTPKNREAVQAIRALAEELDIALTVHAPYYVNLNAAEKPKLEASKKRVISALTMAEVAGASSVCVHAAFNMGKPPEEVYENVYAAVEEILSHKKEHFPHVNLALETMGKPSQFGTLEETLRISKDFDIYPCVDFAHIHARFGGRFNSADEWNQLLDQYAAVLGKNALKNMHIHYSGINYTDKGERNHLPLEESDANWREFLAVLKERKVGGVLVCESPVMEEDTLLLLRVYKRMV